MRDHPERKVRVSKKRERRFATAASVIVIVAIILIFGFIVYTTFFPPETLKAAIIDQLGIKYTNQTFIQTSTAILHNAGFSVDYYESHEVTVDFYRKLPTHGYDLIVLRVHSVTHGPEGNYTGLFTSEPFKIEKYLVEQLDYQVGKASFFPYREGDSVYFGINSRFVRLGMQGTFERTVIVLMGCNGLTHNDLAEAFVEKGAKVFISWSNLVSITRTDEATTKLLEHLITEKQTIRQAIKKTNEEVGPDPEFDSILLYYPLEAGDHVAVVARSSLTQNIITLMENLASLPIMLANVTPFLPEPSP